MAPSWLFEVEEGKAKRIKAASEVLYKMIDALRDPDEPYLDDDTLQSLGIKVSYVELDGNKDTQLSNFFSPIPIKSWPASFDPDAEFIEDELDGGRLQEAVGIDYDLSLWINKPIDGEDGHVPNLQRLSKLRQLK